MALNFEIARSSLDLNHNYICQFLIIICSLTFNNWAANTILMLAVYDSKSVK